MSHAETELKEIPDCADLLIEMSHEIRDSLAGDTSWFADAFAQGRFETLFQAAVDTTEHKVVGQECLIYLPGPHPRNGAEILEAARQSDSLTVFDRYACQLAIRSAVARLVEGAATDTCFINFVPSAVESIDAFIASLVRTLAGTSPRNFVLEAVHSDLTGNSGQLRALRAGLREAGFRFSLDNAGVSGNSFQMMADLRPDFVRIDRRVVSNAEQPVCAATIQKLVQVAESNGIQVIAMGVERPRVLENLWLLGVQLMQGWLFGKPSVRPLRPGPASDLFNLAQALGPAPKRLSHQNPPPLFADLN